MVNFGPIKQSNTRRLSIGGKGLPSLELSNRSILAIIALILAGCATDRTDGDPLEPVNRAIHGANKGLDRAILRPISVAYGAVTPDPVENGLRNSAANLRLPADAINHTLQGDIPQAARSATRFVVNSTVGVLGLFDPAEDIGISADSTDFGQTLAVWGVGEGPYVELPVLGPATGRAAVGRVVDILIDPVSLLVKKPEIDAVYGMRALEVVDTRHRLGQVIDSTLYDSADSYAAAKSAYLDNRRRVLKGSTTDEDLDDPFAFDE